MPFGLKASAVTRWTSFWLCACSLLSAKPSFRLLLAPMHVIIARVFASIDKLLKSLQDVFRAVGSGAFWDAVGQYILLLVPSIESGLILQGGDATLSDVVYCCFRQDTRLLDATEYEVIGNLESQ